MTEQATRAVGPKPVVLTGPITHACGAWWTGTRVSHCGGCHITCSSLSAFDAHQRGGGKVCRDPAEVGLVPVEKPYGVLWSWPSSDTNPHARADER